MQNSGIYKLEFPDGRYYIGQSSNLSVRKTEHNRLLVKGMHSNYRVQQVFDTTKILPIFTVIKYCDVAQLNSEEEKYIDLLDANCLNIKGGGNSNFGYNAATSKYLTSDIEMAFLLLVNNPGISHKEVSEFVGIDINTVHDISAGRNRAFTEMKTKYPEEYERLLKQKAANTRGKTTIVLQHENGTVVKLKSGEYSEFCRNTGVQSPNLSKVITGKRKSTMGWKLLDKYENI